MDEGVFVYTTHDDLIQPRKSNEPSPSDRLEIVPPADEGWLVIRNKQDSIIIGSGKDMVVVTFKSTTNAEIHIKTADAKPICRLHHLTEEKKELIKPYIPPKFLK